MPRNSENPAYLTDQIITYIGNKRALLSPINAAINDCRKALGQDKISFLDLFSGSGIVARSQMQNASCLYANDLETYARITNQCYLRTPSKHTLNTLRATVEQLANTAQTHPSPGFLTALYAPEDEANIAPDERVFFTRANAIYLDTARQLIDSVDENLRPYLLAPLIAAASVSANTSGVFKGFYKNKQGIGQYGGEAENALTRIRSDIRLAVPVTSKFQPKTHIFQQDAGKLVKDLDPVDVAYFDPPYNQHPYGSNYFMLNLLATYEAPAEISKVSGIPKDWNRSDYNRRSQAEAALFTAVSDCKARFVLISYSSEGFIPHEVFLKEMNALGRLTVIDTPYNTFRGSRNLSARSSHVVEYLYLLDRR